MSTKSEKVAKVFKEHRIQATHRPMQTLASALFNKKKDKIHDMDKAGVVYYHKCTDCGADYVGETERCWRQRMHEHRLVDRTTANESHTFRKQETTRQEPQGTRKSTRIAKKDQNYMKMHTGGPGYLTPGQTPVAEHVTLEHGKERFQSEIIATDHRYRQRGIREALAIQKLNPSLNQDDGRFQLSPIYTILAPYNTRTGRKTEIETGQEPMRPLINNSANQRPNKELRQLTQSSPQLLKKASN